MIEYIKEKLLNNIEYLKELLEYYGYCNISVHRNYISFGRDEVSSPKSIVIKTENNKYLYVTDYARNLSCDIFKFIILQKNVEFKDIIGAAKRIIGIDDFYEIETKSTKAFGGFYNKIKTRHEIKLKIYNESILNKYVYSPNKRFLDDGISLQTQKDFFIGYDVENQAISIPIWNEIGELIGVKERINKDPEDGEQKYFYDIPCNMSFTLYGYYQNYQYLESAETIYIFESEKAVMQCYSMGIRNTVALGSSSVSKRQCQLLLNLDPKNIVFMHDKGLDFKVIERNLIFIKSYSIMREINLKYWIPNEDIPDKASASDLGKEKFDEIIKNQIVKYE